MAELHQGDIWWAGRADAPRPCTPTALLARRHTEHGSGLGMIRYVAEQSQALLHQFKRLRTRYDVRDDIHESFLDPACCVICWRRLQRGYF